MTKILKQSRSNCCVNLLAETTFCSFRGLLSRILWFSHVNISLQYCACDVGRSSGERAVLSSQETQSSLSQFFSSFTSLVQTTPLSTAPGRTVTHRCSNRLEYWHHPISRHLLTYSHPFMTYSVVFFTVDRLRCREAHHSCLLTSEFRCL